MKNKSQTQNTSSAMIGQYQIIKKIGSGLTAQVYEAKSQNHGKVSIKIIEPSFRRSQTGASLINNQIFILETLNHKNVLKMIEKIEKNNKVHIITQYCEGGNLERFIKKYKKLNEKIAINYMKKIVEGCIYLKSKNIIHRDLKPSNIFIKDSQPIIADFGFAVYEHNKKLLNINAGSPLYMPIQSLKDKKFSQKSDVFALGVIFYEMLTGKLPWIANSQEQLIMKLKTPPQIPIQLYNRTGRIISKCLLRDGKDRPTFQQILTELNERIRQLETKNEQKQLKENKMNITMEKKQKKSLSFTVEDKNKRKNEDKQNINMVKIVMNEKCRSITLNNRLTINQQSDLSFLQKLNPDQFKFLPLSLIHKFKCIINHYKKITGGSTSDEDPLKKCQERDELIIQLNKCKTEFEICKTIESFIRRLYRLTKNYKEYRGCLAGMEMLYKRISTVIL